MLPSAYHKLFSFFYQLRSFGLQLCVQPSGVGGGGGGGGGGIHKWVGAISDGITWKWAGLTQSNGHI